MIDLSYLTEEEQGAIMTVLKRDAELKKAEEERIKQLQFVPTEESQLKYMTGEWFYAVKSQRHQDRIHGSEIIWASMRQKKPDFTRSMEKPRRSSGVDDVIATPRPPPQQPVETQEQKDRRSESLTSEAQQETLRLALRSPKLRHNPFNNLQVEIDTERPSPQLPNGTQGSSETHKQEIPPSQTAQRELLGEAKAEEPVAPVKRPAPVPRKRTKLPRTQSSRTDSSGSGVTTSTTSTTRGILKQASSCSSVDSHQRSEPSGAEAAQESEPVEVKAAVEGRKEEEEEVEEDTHMERREEGKRHFVPVPAEDIPEKRQKSEEMTQQHTATSRSDGGHQRETTSRSDEGHQRETTSRSDGGHLRETTSRSDEGHQRETPPQTSRSKHDAGRSLGLSVFTCPEESGGKAQQLFSPAGSRSTRPAWPPTSDQPLREKVAPQNTPHRWRDSSAERTPLRRHDPDIRAKDTNTDSPKAAEDTLHESKRSFLPPALDVVEKPADIERSKSPVAPVAASQPSKLTEEEGNSIAKVLEWFNRSTDSSNRQDTDSVQDLEETKDDITDSEEEAKPTVSKPSGNVYAIIPRQEKPKEKKKLFPDDVCLGEEQSVDLSDEAPEPSDSEIEGPTITVRPFQPGQSRDSTHQLHPPVRAVVKPETSSQPHQSSQSPLQTEATFKPQRSVRSPVQTEATFQSQRSIQSPVQTEATFQSQCSVQSPVQTEATFQSQRYIQSPVQTEATFQSQRSVQSPVQTEATFQSQRSVQSPVQTEATFQSQRHIQSPLQTERTMVTNRTTNQSKHPIRSAVKTEINYQPRRAANSTPNKEMTVQTVPPPVQTHPPVHSVRKTDTVFKAEQHRPDTQRQGPARLEDVRVLRGEAEAGGSTRQDPGVEAGGGIRQDPRGEAVGNTRQDPRVSQQQDRQTSGQDEKPKIANLKSFWERGNSGPKILISRTNLNTEKKSKPDRQLDIGQAVREQVEEPQKSVQNFEIRSMSTSLKPRNEEKSHRKQAVELRAQEQDVEDTLIKQKYMNVEVEDENVPESASSTQGSEMFEVSSRVEKDVTSSEVKSPPFSLSTSRFAKKVSEEAMKYPRTASEPPVPLTRSAPAPKAEDGEEETPPESRSLSRTSTPVLPSSPVLPAKQNTQHLENRRQRLRKLKSFWESEVSGPKFSSSPPSTLNKRFTKSAFDLRSTGLGSNDDFDDDSGEHSFSILTLKDKSEKPSPGDTNFKSLKNFWAGSPSVQARPKSPTSEYRLDRSKSPPAKLHETAGAPQSDCTPQGRSQPNPTYSSRGTDEVLEKACGRSREESWHSKASSANREKEHPSSPSLKTRHRGKDEGGTGKDSRRGSVDSRAGRSNHRATGAEPEQRKAVPHQSRRNSEQVSLSSALALKNRSGQPCRTSTGNLNERAGGLRKATSMYSLAFREDQDQTPPEPPKKSQEFSPAKGKKMQEFGLSFSKKVPEVGKSRERVNERRPSRTSEDPEWQQPLARSFIPRDFQHYLGIPERTGTAPAPEPRDEVCTSFSATSQPDCEWSHGGGPVRSSTPVGPEEVGGRRGSLGPRPSYGVRANDEFSQESPRSSASESWTSSRKNSKCDEEEEEEEEEDGPVQRALRRAAARPAFTKSLEDITAVRGPEKESEKASIFMHSSGDASPGASTLASSFADTDHLRKMSKSVPSFLGEDVSGSVMSVCSGDFGGVEVQGTIQFTLNYVQKLKEFHIFVVQCKNLAGVDPKKSRSDPYVKSYLIPDKAGLGKRKTSVKKRTINPLFNEILRYRVRMDYLKSQVLNLSVWHHDTFGKNSFLGEVEMDLSVWDFRNTQMNYMSLKARTTSSTQPTEYRGEMKLAVRYLPQMSYSKTPSNSGEVHIWVKECKNLPLVRGATIDPYVKCFMLPDTSRKSRQKTRVLKRTDCPVFNHTMVYDGFQPEDLREACVELTVWDRDRLASHLLGGLRLGLGTGKSYSTLVDWMDSTAQEVALWERMMDSPTEWVEDVMPLRVLMTHANK
ncbi:serine/arginine repetitive matrix protein 2 isoform X2 [Clupea harengus]|uniref:Synaptotagmin-like protein 2 n=1 Tax=Clupea harengus TaxID=7950 RepID=A0A6P8GYK5_CLUHA|nr:serine/arginine repetitive matrix protein 2 isoform X2 [Clupea harengus]